MLFFQFAKAQLVPQRIISLAPSLTKNLYLLDAGDLLVGCTNYCTIQSATEAEVIATAIQVNFEKAFMLKPDLLITTDLTKANTIQKFEKLGVKVKVFSNPLSFVEICDQFLELGELVGRKEIAQNVLKVVYTELETIKNKIKAPHKDRVFMQIGANPLFGVVPTMFMNDLIKYSGTENILGDLGMGSVNQEVVLMRDPDIIAVVLMGSNSEDEINYWKRFKNMNAVKHGRIFTLDPDDACSPTPVSFVKALKEMIAQVYP